MKRLFMILLTLVMALSVTSCNMLRGLGKDIEHVGDSIEHVVH